MSEAAIELSGLGRRYGRQYVLREINLEMTAGRLALLGGSNGAGKTTLLRVLATRLRPSRGRGRVFGFDLVTGAHEVRRRVAFLSVFGGSYPTLTAAENLMLAARLYGLRGAEVTGLLATVGLEAVADKLVRTFSSGMKKRLALARLLLADVPLWLLDEPYASLDEDGKALIDRLLIEARAAGRSVLLASHETARCAPLVDAVLTLEGGGLRAVPREIERV